MTNNVKNLPADLAKEKLIIESVSENIPLLIRGKEYFAEELIGPDLWSTLDTGTRIDIGKSVRKLVKNRLLPLVDAGKASNNKRIYSLD